MGKRGPKVGYKPTTPQRKVRTRFVIASNDDPRVDLWLKERCELGPDLREKAIDLALDFAYWCTDQGYKLPAFGYLAYHLGARGFNTRPFGRGSVKVGLRLISGPRHTNSV